MNSHNDGQRAPSRDGGLALVFGILSLCALPDVAWAADNIFGGTSPLATFVDFITGPFAYAVVILALVATVGSLALGGEFSGFTRRMPIIVVAGAIVILADTVMTNLFSGARAYSLPAHVEVELWEASATLAQTPTGSDACAGSAGRGAGPC